MKSSRLTALVDSEKTTECHVHYYGMEQFLYSVLYSNATHTCNCHAMPFPWAKAEILKQ